MAYDFEERDIKGNTVKLSGLQGKVVLIDFWATWCAPCVAEIPNVKKAYEKYGKDGRFKVIAISLDERKETVQEFAKKQGLEWPQIVLGPAEKNALAIQYGVSGIPATFLIDKTGRVAAKDLRGDALESAVERVLNSQTPTQPGMAQVAAAPTQSSRDLIAAAWKGEMDAAKSCLESDADANAKGLWGRTPLHFAVDYGHKEIIELLVKHGGDPKVKDDYGDTPLYLAAKAGNKEFAKLLAKRDEDHDILAASSLGMTERVKALLKENKSLSDSMIAGWRPLHAAARHGHSEIAKMLLSHGADADAMDGEEWTPLHRAIEGGHVETVKVLIEGGADVSLTIEGGITPHDRAIWEGHDEIQKLLKGAPTNRFESASR
jgi:ankyrin repeat protein/peroxiredoxin